jgi:hypothetical protein
MKIDFVGSFRIGSAAQFNVLTLSLDSFTANTPSYFINRVLVIDDISDPIYFKGYDFSEGIIEVPNAHHLGEFGSRMKAANLLSNMGRGDALFVLDLSAYFNKGWADQLDYVFTGKDDNSKLLVSKYGWFISWELWDKSLINNG